jgi:benzoate 4-monooxygenase
MAFLSSIFAPWGLAVVFPAWLLAYYIFPYFTTYRHLSRVPGPFTAKFSNTWVGLSARRGQKFAAVDSAHRRYGKVVRIGFNHVSIADERGINVIYGHGNGFLKEYGSFQAIPNVFRLIE